MIKELLREHSTPPREVYFDLENSGYVPDEVVEAMVPFFNKYGYGHPAITHKPGWEALDLLMEAKELVSKTVEVGDPEGFIFTHSGTEANNLAIQGYVIANRERLKGKKILVSSIEHLSVIFAAEFIGELFGLKVVRVPVDGEGSVDPEILKYYVDRDTALVSIQLVNHEIGTIQRLRDLVDIVRDGSPEAVIHTDASSAYGRVKVNLKELGVDMMTLSSHKIHGPRGVGLLYIGEGVRVEPIVRGQLSVEKLWPGVELIPLIAGFKKAVELMLTEFEENVSYMTRLRDKLMTGILSSVSEVIVNGPLGDRRAPDNVNVSFRYVEGEALTVELSHYGVYVSSGSACSSRFLEPSHVLLAIGREYELAHGSILFKVSRYHREDDITYALEVLPKSVERLRKISPLTPKKVYNYRNNSVIWRQDK
ncbi:MAG: cysteine desulfurase family protein [Zestosphaera sp.]